MRRWDMFDEQTCQTDNGYWVLYEDVEAEIERAKQNLNRDVAIKLMALESELSTLRRAAEEMKIVLGEAYIILAGLHEGTDWEIAPIIRVKMAEVAKQAESVLARYQATKKG